MPKDDAEANFYDDVQQKYDENVPDFAGCLNVALVGKVSAGKSSLINAIMQRDRSDPIARVGAVSGVTTKVTRYELAHDVVIVDCPGLNDVRQENTDETNAFLRSIDLGIFVVTGSADSSQRQIFDDLKRNARHVIVALNKIDEWDDHEDAALESVQQQWAQVLGVDKVFPVSAKGYDPQYKVSRPMDIRGIDELREQIEIFLEKEKKTILFQRHLKDKHGAAVKIIAAAVAVVMPQALLPGSAVYITATQAIAINSLNYLYRGEALSRASVLSILPRFVGQSLGRNLFLWLKSLLPPTGVVDAAAAAVAASITASMLAAVKYLLENEKSLDDKKEISAAFKIFEKLGGTVKDLGFDQLKSKEGAIKLIEGWMRAKQQ